MSLGGYRDRLWNLVLAEPPPPFDETFRFQVRSRARIGAVAITLCYGLAVDHRRRRHRRAFGSSGGRARRARRRLVSR